MPTRQAAASSSAPLTVAELEEEALEASRLDVDVDEVDDEEEEDKKLSFLRLLSSSPP